MREQETFANRLTHLIREHNISHAEIGRIVGVSGQAVGKWAKGGNIEYDNLKSLAKHFDVNWIWLRYGDDAMISFSERRTGSKARRAVIKSIVDNEQRMRLALDAATIGTWDLDIVGDQIVLSEVAEKIFGGRIKKSMVSTRTIIANRISTIEKIGDGVGRAKPQPGRMPGGGKGRRGRRSFSTTS